MGSKSQTLQDWMLPGAIVLGISLYLLYRTLAFLHPAGPVLHALASEGQRFVIAVLLFLQFVRISPSDIHIRKWHVAALLFQVLGFLFLGGLVYLGTEGEIRILLECAMLCLICPTASAAGVITEKLGGSLPGSVTYVTLANIAATFFIPMVIPLVRPADSLGFWEYVGHIALRVFPLLILPGALAWMIRAFAPRLHGFLTRLSSYAFWVWGLGLTLAMLLASRALALSLLSAGAVACVVLVSIGSCALQFFAGRHMGRNHSDAITAGQALGQKNTGFLIWLGYNYMTPVTSVAGGLYAIWQNLFNSWQLYRSVHHNNQTSLSNEKQTLRQ